jgi:hypothetical protein
LLLTYGYRWRHTKTVDNLWLVFALLRDDFGGHHRGMLWVGCFLPPQASYEQWRGCG